MPAQLFRRIAVATDGSASAKAAVAMAIALAKTYGSELLVLTVAPLVPVYAAPNAPLVAAPLPESAAPRYRELVDTAVQEAKAAGLTAVSGVCEEGVVVDEILAQIDERRPDLLVVGSRGLTAAKRLLLGSVSTALVTHAACPVLVVRPSSSP